MRVGKRKVKEKTPKNACFIPDTALPHLRSDHVTSTDHIPATITLTEDSQNFSKEENDTTTGSPQTYPTIFATLTILRYSSDSPIRPTTPPIHSTIPRYTRRSSKDTSGIAALIDIPEHVIGTRTAYPSAPRNVSRPLAPRADLPDFVDRASHSFPFIFVCFDIVRLLVPLRSVVPAPPSHPLFSRFVCLVCHILSSSSILCVFVFEPLNVL